MFELTKFICTFLFFVPKPITTVYQSPNRDLGRARAINYKVMNLFDCVLTK